MRNLMMVVSYDGTRYHGFQTQPIGNTIQDKLEEAIFAITGERISVEASGRTDAGVHAKGQVINFRTRSAIPVERWCLALNSRLPPDIMVVDAKEAPEDFHARFSAKRKTYRYSIQRTKFADVFHRTTQFHHHRPLDVESMRLGLKLLEGEHDFSSFCSVHASVGSHVRTIFDTKMELLTEPDHGDGPAGVIHIYITGNGFLYNMVRIIVGTLLEIGQGKRHWSSMQAILEGKNRALAGPTAVAHGLMLWEVKY